MPGSYFNSLNESKSLALRKLGDEAATIADIPAKGMLAKDFVVSATMFGVLTAASYYSINARKFSVSLIHTVKHSRV